MTTYVPVEFYNPATEERFRFLALEPSFIGYEDKMGLVVHEVPGRDGGIVNVTGRLTSTISLTGKIIGTTDEIEEQIRDFDRIFRDAVPLEFTSFLIWTTVVISSFKPSLDAGLENQVPYTATLTEYRAPDNRELSVNLVNFTPKNQIIQRLVNRGVLSDAATEEST